MGSNELITYYEDPAIASKLLPTFRWLDRIPIPRNFFEILVHVIKKSNSVRIKIQPQFFKEFELRRQREGSIWQFDFKYKTFLLGTYTYVGSINFLGFVSDIWHSAGTEEVRNDPQYCTSLCSSNFRISNVSVNFTTIWDHPTCTDIPEGPWKKSFGLRVGEWTDSELHTAANLGDLKRAKFLIKYGSKIDAKNAR